MKLARFSRDGIVSLGKVTGDRVVDLSSTLNGVASMRTLLARLPELRPALEKAQGEDYPLAQVVLEAPIDDPQKFLAIGMNYEDHAREAEAAGVARPKHQLWFNKQVSCINGPYATIDLPKVSDRLDYEAELGVVIGQRCRHVSRESARDVIVGYLVVNDVSVRDWQAQSPTFTLGKSFDTHGPIGPWITTADEIQDPMNLHMRLTVNGAMRQQACTRDMIYSIYEQIAHLSTVMTLEPGDILATGTPAGVGGASGFFLKAGDVVRVEIDGLGAIENRVAPEA